MEHKYEQHDNKYASDGLCRSGCLRKSGAHADGLRRRFERLELGAGFGQRI